MVILRRVAQVFDRAGVQNIVGATSFGGWPALQWTSLPQGSKRVPRPCGFCKGGALRHLRL